MAKKKRSFLLGLLVLALGASPMMVWSCGGDDSVSAGNGCPGAIILSCIEQCPIDCAAQGLQEVCVGPDFFDNPNFAENERCCFCQ